MGKCKKCRSCTKISSHTIQNLQTGCLDVCVNPVCGTPDLLSIMAPLIYDEIGINLCTTFPLGVDVIGTYPTAVKATAQIINISYDYGEDNVLIENIPNRPNCYLITLSNLSVTFAINLYDASCRLLGTVYPVAVYLPSSDTAPTYDEDTNPESVALEIFAPYGISYAAGSVPPSPILNYIGFFSDNNFVRQGINLFAIPKILNFDITDSAITVGVTLILQSLYFAGYNVTNAGRISTPKGSLNGPEDSECLNFVAGELLDLAIRPLDLSLPTDETPYICSPSCNACQPQASCSCNVCQSQTPDSCSSCNVSYTSGLNVLSVSNDIPDNSDS